MKVICSETEPSEESNDLHFSDSKERVLLQTDACVNPTPDLVVAVHNLWPPQLLKVATEVSEGELVNRYSFNCFEDDRSQPDITILYPKVEEIVARYAGKVESEIDDDIIILHPNDDDIIRRYAPQLNVGAGERRTESFKSEENSTLQLEDSANKYTDFNSSTVQPLMPIKNWSGCLPSGDLLIENIERDSYDDGNANGECTDDDEIVQGHSLLSCAVSTHDKIVERKTKSEELCNEIPSCNADDECCSSSCSCPSSHHFSAVDYDAINTETKINHPSETSETELSDEREGFGDLLDGETNDIASDRLTEEFNDSCYDSVDADDAIPAINNSSGSPIPSRNITVYNVCCDKDFFTSLSIDRKKETIPARKSCRRDMLHGLLKNISHSNIFEGTAGNIRKSFVNKKFKDKNKFKRQMHSDHLLNLILALEKSGQKFESFCIQARRSLRKSNSVSNVVKTGSELKEELTPLLEQQLTLIQKIRTNVQ